MAPIQADTIDDAAIAWFVRLRDEQASEADRAAFAVWRKADPAHELAWRELEAVWGALDQLAAPKAAAPAIIANAVPRRKRPIWRQLAVAAMLLLAVMAGLRQLPTGLLADHRTGIGERRTIALSDGSRIELGPDSAIDVDLDGARRGIRLVAGEAFFTVARDEARPFIVSAGQGEIAVLGTAFDVKIGQSETVSVVVTESKVAVSAAGGAAVGVAAGQEVSYDSRGVSPVRKADLDAAQAWRHDQIAFHDASLDTVLSELRRYRRGHVQLLGGELGKRRVTAVFDAKRPDAALETIARNLDLRLLRATDYFVALVAW
ncbi:FecR family protein [Bosea sp. (in: a-proteobacteria)]|uniref:FecR family protein n=1 Tax=Bosea sp. (in: a-proteobacteria) TaxID=1871050 RepID=UPI002FC78E52